eukprot:COSAG05_NODE_8_length_40675_cov_148.837539_41_plen_82_part_00
MHGYKCKWPIHSTPTHLYPRIDGRGQRGEALKSQCGDGAAHVQRPQGLLVMVAWVGVRSEVSSSCAQQSVCKSQSCMVTRG